MENHPSAQVGTRVRPLQGQVLIRLLPNPEKNHAGFYLPDVAFDRQQGDKAKPRRGLVIATGPWRQTKQGFAILPEVKPGDEVILSEYLGAKLTRTIGENLRLCRLDDLLAVLTNGDGSPTVVPPV